MYIYIYIYIYVYIYIYIYYIYICMSYGDWEGWHLSILCHSCEFVCTVS